jgi:hypothetical protein
MEQVMLPPAGSSSPDGVGNGIEDEEDNNSSSSSPSRVTLRQFAEIVGVTYQTALRYKDDKKVAVIKIGGRWFVNRNELDRFLLEGNRGT